MSSLGKRYSRVLGSAVNPVLREGNSDRRVAKPVKEYAQANPHRMQAWSSTTPTHVSHMTEGDFYGSEKSYTVPEAISVKIEHVSATGEVKVLKPEVKLMSGEVIDASLMSVAKLREFYEREITDAFEKDILLSLHLKATMMKVSDPILFGHCVTVFFKDVFAKHGALFKEINVDTRNGLGDLYAKLETIDPAKKAEVLADIDAQYEQRPWLAMVNSAKGITNLHVPSDIIIDASMPVVIRDGGMMWNRDDELEPTKCLIPDRNYAGIYQAVIEFCKANGQFDVSTMGNVANVGLMAQKAEEYGSHDKTFELASAGTVKVTDSTGKVIFEHKVETGDVWRMCQTKDAPIKDWVALAVKRARNTGSKTIFWLDSERAHDAQLIQKVNTYLAAHDTSGLDISIQPPVAAITASMENAKNGKDSISVTGNVLRDYLTDLFPILELGTSAKMLSIVPLLAGGGMFETGAGGSAPKHVQQFEKEGHLRWDSLGEYLALAVSFEHLSETTGNKKAKILADTLNAAISHLLINQKSPSRKVNEPDNRATTFYLSLYWAEELGKHEPSIKKLAEALQGARQEIVAELKSCQGEHMDLGGYYMPDPAKAERKMRPSQTLNRIIEGN